MSSPLDRVLVRLSDVREITLTDLLDAWEVHVERMHGEQNLDPGTGWTAHDLVAALILRDRIDGALTGQPADVRDEASQRIADADKMFSSMTVEDSEGYVRRFAERIGALGWWWSRLPRRGPIRADIERWAAQVFRGL